MKRIFKSLGALLAVPLLAGVSLSTTAKPAHAQADPFLGQMMTVGFNFCPRGWALAEGQLLPISQNTALFSLLGCTYGGDCRTTFGLPDLRGRQVTGVGQGAGLAATTWGQRGGAETHTMIVQEMPSHNHLVQVTNAVANKDGPGNDYLASGGGTEPMYHDGPPNRFMEPDVITNTGGNVPFNIEDPFLGMYVCIATTGIFPSRN